MVKLSYTGVGGYVVMAYVRGLYYSHNPLVFQSTIKVLWFHTLRMVHTNIHRREQVSSNKGTVVTLSVWLFPNEL